MKNPTILIINDGNRRWAKEKELSVSDGYQKMAERIALVCDELNTKGFNKVYFACCTIENLSRPKEEVEAYFEKYLLAPSLSKNKIKVELHGNLELIPEKFKNVYNQLVENTSSNTDFTLHYMINWSIDDELARVFNRLNGKEGEIDWQKLNENADIKEPIDLILRTGQRNRLSACIPFNSPYAEIYFLDKLFPDIKSSDIDEVLSFYQSQLRTFGK